MSEKDNVILWIPQYILIKLNIPQFKNQEHK